MSRRPAHIPQRVPIFVACEGDSEAAYVSFLRALADDANLPVHIHIEPFPAGVGDPLARVERAKLRLRQLRLQRGVFGRRFILLDSDQLELARDRGERAVRLAHQEGIELIWQRPCHEAFLLRHLPHRADRHPASARDALRVLQRDWETYAKPMTRLQLAARLDLESVYRAARVEPDLATLLRVIGLTGFE
ncbi:RloB domain-containing protein [Brevundimonas sp.]|uniref:RloB domain-containing protein n=1 Tax=Brevundimonas sp. TaxID=1871086 RepID=UPI00345DC70B